MDFNAITKLNITANDTLKDTIIGSGTSGYTAGKNIPQTINQLIDAGGSSSSPVKSVTTGHGLNLNSSGTLSMSTATSSADGAMTSAQYKKLSNLPSSIPTYSAGTGISISNYKISTASGVPYGLKWSLTTVRCGTAASVGGVFYGNTGTICASNTSFYLCYGTCTGTEGIYGTAIHYTGQNSVGIRITSWSQNTDEEAHMCYGNLPASAIEDPIERKYYEKHQNDIQITDDEQLLFDINGHDIYIPDKKNISCNVGDNITLESLGWTYFYNTLTPDANGDMIHKQGSWKDFEVSGLDTSKPGIFKVVISRPELHFGETFYLEVK